MKFISCASNEEQEGWIDDCSLRLGQNLYRRRDDNNPFLTSGASAFPGIPRAGTPGLPCLLPGCRYRPPPGPTLSGGCSGDPRSSCGSRAAFWRNRRLGIGRLDGRGVPSHVGFDHHHVIPGNETTHAPMRVAADRTVSTGSGPRAITIRVGGRQGHPMIADLVAGLPPAPEVVSPAPGKPL